MIPTIDPSNPDASNPHASNPHVDLASAFGETLLDELRERGGHAESFRRHERSSLTSGQRHREWQEGDHRRNHLAARKGAGDLRRHLNESGIGVPANTREQRNRYFSRRRVNQLSYERSGELVRDRPLSMQPEVCFRRSSASDVTDFHRPEAPGGHRHGVWIRSRDARV